MIVCHCHGITDRQIRREFGPGGTRQCPAGSSCGGCAATISQIMDQLRGESGGTDTREPSREAQPTAMRSRNDR